MKIQNVLYLTYDQNDVPIIRDTVDENTLGTLLNGNFLNPLYQEMYYTISKTGVNPDPDNTRLLEALRRHQQAIERESLSQQNLGSQLTALGNDLVAEAKKLSDQRIKNNGAVWDQNLQGMQNSLNHRLDRLNAQMQEMSTALCGGIFPSAYDTPRCLHADGSTYDRAQFPQMSCAFVSNTTPNLGGYFLRGASPGGNPYRVLHALADTVYMGVEVTADLGTFKANHDTTNYIELGGNGWAAATGCFKEWGIAERSGEIYRNGGKGSKDKNYREDCIISLQMNLLENFRYATETRPRNMTFQWVMYGGLAPDSAFLPAYSCPYKGGQINADGSAYIPAGPGTVGPGGTVDPGSGNHNGLTVTLNNISFGTDNVMVLLNSTPSQIPGDNTVSGYLQFPFIGGSTAGIQGFYQNIASMELADTYLIPATYFGGQFTVMPAMYPIGDYVPGSSPNFLYTSEAAPQSMNDINNNAAWVTWCPIISDPGGNVLNGSMKTIALNGNPTVNGNIVGPVVPDNTDNLTDDQIAQLEAESDSFDALVNSLVWRPSTDMPLSASTTDKYGHSVTMSTDFADEGFFLLSASPATINKLLGVMNVQSMWDSSKRQLLNVSIPLTLTLADGRSVDCTIGLSLYCYPPGFGIPNPYQSNGSPSYTHAWDNNNSTISNQGAVKFYGSWGIQTQGDSTPVSLPMNPLPYYKLDGGMPFLNTEWPLCNLWNTMPMIGSYGLPGASPTVQTLYLPSDAAYLYIGFSTNAVITGVTDSADKYTNFDSGPVIYNVLIKVDEFKNKVATLELGQMGLYGIADAGGVKISIDGKVVYECTGPTDAGSNGTVSVYGGTTRYLYMSPTEIGTEKETPTGYAEVQGPYTLPVTDQIMLWDSIRSYAEAFTMFGVTELPVGFKSQMPYPRNHFTGSGVYLGAFGAGLLPMATTADPFKYGPFPGVGYVDPFAK